MEGSVNIEKAYELIEQFEFAELSDADRLYVLSVMTETEYSDMRRTVSALNVLMDSDIEPRAIIPVQPQKSRGGRLLRMVNYQVKMYQVAASVALLIASYVVFHVPDQQVVSPLIARVDTVFVHQTDTVYATLYDTVTIVEYKVEPKHGRIHNPESTETVAQSDKSIDCSQELCPSEVGAITEMNRMNSISSDSTLRGLLVSL